MVSTLVAPHSTTLVLMDMANSPALVKKLWNTCNILRDDGLSYGDCVEQVTFLLFLKMADEQPQAPNLGTEKGQDAVYLFAGALG